jgi:hypothetical protein
VERESVPARTVSFASPNMLTYAVLLATGAAAYANTSAWVVPAVAAGLTLADWRPWRPSRQAPLASSAKAVTYLVAGGVAHVVLAAVAFGAGRIARQLLG